MMDILSRLQAFDTLLKAQQTQISQIVSSTQEQFKQVDTRLQRLDTLDDTIINLMNLHQVESMSAIKNQFADMMNHMLSQLPASASTPVPAHSIMATADPVGYPSQSTSPSTHHPSSAQKLLATRHPSIPISLRRKDYKLRSLAPFITTWSIFHLHLPRLSCQTTSATSTRPHRVPHE